MASPVRRQEQNRIGNFLRLGNLAQRDTQLKLVGETLDHIAFAVFVLPHPAQHRGIGRTGGNQVTAYAIRRHFQPHGLAQAAHSGLGGAVGRHANTWHMGRVGGNAHDGPLLLTAEHRQGMTEQVKSTTGVHRHAGQPVRIAGFIGQPHAQNASPIDQHVQPLMFRQ
ncbi:hypothetical protein D3C75_1044810 [compost metagenome]